MSEIIYRDGPQCNSLQLEVYVTDKGIGVETETQSFLSFLKGWNIKKEGQTENLGPYAITENNLIKVQTPPIIIWPPTDDLTLAQIQTPILHDNRSNDLNKSRIKHIKLQVNLPNEKTNLVALRINQWQEQ